MSAPSDTTALSVEEVTRRMPTLGLIDDARVRAVTTRLTQSAPAYFWRVPATRSNYHHPECRKERGLWAHTLMLSTVIHRLGESSVELGSIDREDVSLAHSAAILHDQRKNGDLDSPSHASTSDHDLRMAAVVWESPLPDRVADAVAAHNGPWCDGPAPQAPLEQLVHVADMVASSPAITPGVQGPIPAELDALDLHEVDLH